MKVIKRLSLESEEGNEINDCLIRLGKYANDNRSRKITTEVTLIIIWVNKKIMNEWMNE